MYEPKDREWLFTFGRWLLGQNLVPQNGVLVDFVKAGVVHPDHVLVESAWTHPSS